MKKSIVAAALVGALLAGMGTAHAADPIKLKLKWVPQAQFAGYYVAQSKGYYTDENLDVSIDAASTKSAAAANRSSSVLGIAPVGGPSNKAKMRFIIQVN